MSSRRSLRHHPRPSVPDHDHRYITVTVITLAPAITPTQVVSGWPPSESISLCCALHAALKVPSRVQLVIALEPQLGEDECDFLAAACAREKAVAHAGTQTAWNGAQGAAASRRSDWRSVFDSYQRLDEAARVRSRSPSPTPNLTTSVASL
jgi:hypothetical protein